MLMLKNCSVPDFRKEAGNKRIIPFGIGSWFKALETEGLAFLAKQCPYAIDNAFGITKVVLHGKEIPVYSPEKLRTETDCIVLLTSPIYMYDMYMQLDQMELEGKITCYGFPFMTITDNQHISEELVGKVLKNNSDNKATKIPRIIHGFWFSGEEKPPEYQRCFDSWQKKCPAYEIREWTKANYDTSKNSFLKKAIELGAWAAASDYARLDVLYQYGGFYLDMDVELIKPLDDMLDNSALFSFEKSTTIYLEVVVEEPFHPLIVKLLEK